MATLKSIIRGYVEMDNDRGNRYRSAVTGRFVKKSGAAIARASGDRFNASNRATGQRSGATRMAKSTSKRQTSVKRNGRASSKS